MKKRPSLITLCFRILLIGAVAILTSKCKNDNDTTKNKQSDSIRELVRDEETVLEVTTLTKSIASAIKNKTVINPESRSLFSDRIDVTDLLALPQALPQKSEDTHTALGISRVELPLAKKQSNLVADKTYIWKVLFDSVDTISDASFGFVSAQSDSPEKLQSTLKFSAKGIDKQDNRISLKGTVVVSWIKPGGKWKISSWHTNKMTLTRSKKLLFRNRMEDLFSSTDLALATRSFHEEKLTEYITNNNTHLPKSEYGPYFKAEADYQHPSVSVVDINSDGWDDLFVTSLWAPCQLWINHGGKHFTEEAHEYGLNIVACCTSAIFADFDNDGDADLMLGRSLERSQLLWNENNQFTPSSIELPYLVTSLSVADCNNDGLLDIYLCTYGPSGTAAKYSPEWVQQFLPPESHATYRAALSSSHPFFNQAGPRNYLLINRGDRQFETAPPSPVIDQYHNSYQGSWSDYDKDGDLDLYICNDFAPDALLRNNGIDASCIPQFTDVSETLSNNTMKGFGMGASWGDYDNDKKPDLFVSNMYSKAGHRVLSRFSNLDERMHFSARGNLLFKQADGKFKQLAGENKDTPVDQGGWAFGGQFIDVNNDAWLDIYVPNGFYTAPKSVASEVDL